MGLRRRVSIGFISIVGVLILSGMVSFFELNTLSRETDKILDLNTHYGLMSKMMINALNDQNRAFTQMTAFEDPSYEVGCRESMARLDSLLTVAREESTVPEVVDSMMVVAADLRRVSDEFLVMPIQDSLLLSTPDSLQYPRSREIYDRYLPIYDKMLGSVYIYNKESIKALAPGAEQLHNNAYRAVTPILLSLSVMIVIVLMLYYFIMSYCVTPIIRVNDSLKGYLTYKIPFAPKSGARDELLEMTERVELLIKQNKQSTKES